MFDKSAGCYDLIYGSKNYEAEADFIHHVIEASRSPAQTVLDLGCGTGEHGVALSTLFNYEVTGIDINREMIAISQQKKTSANFQYGDMTNFSLGRKYDVIISMFSAIGWLKSIDRVSQAFACASQHLNEGGLIVIEPWFTPDEFNGGHVFMDTGESADTKICRMSRTQKVGNVSVIDFHYMHGTAEKIEAYNERHEIGLFTHEELLQQLEAVGIKAEYIRFPNVFDERGLLIGKKIEHDDVFPK